MIVTHNLNTPQRMRCSLAPYDKASETIPIAQLIQVSPCQPAFTAVPSKAYTSWDLYAFIVRILDWLKGKEQQKASSLS